MNASSKKKKARLMLIASMCIVGTVGVIRRYIPLSSPLLAFFRGLIGGATLLPAIGLRKEKRKKKIGGKTLAGLILNGIFLGVNWILLFEAFNFTTIAKATLCYYMEPTIVLLLSPLVFRERLTAKKIVCAVLSLTGMVFVSGVIGTDGVSAADRRGILFGLGAAYFYALVVILNKKITGADTYRRTVIQLFSAAGALLPYLLFTGAFKNITCNATLVWQLLLIGVVYTGLVYALYFGSMRDLPAQTISILSYIDPVVAMLSSVMVFKETLTVWGIAGAVLILGAAAVSETGTQKRRKRHNK